MATDPVKRIREHDYATPSRSDITPRLVRATFAKEVELLIVVLSSCP